MAMVGRTKNAEMIIEKIEKYILLSGNLVRR